MKRISEEKINEVWRMPNKAWCLEQCIDAQLAQDQADYVNSIRSLQAEHERAVREIFEEIEKTFELEYWGHFLVTPEYKNIKAKYLKQEVKDAIN